MKKYFYLFILLFGITLTSCEKEPLEEEEVYVDPYAIDPSDTTTLYGKYRLISGKMYVTNLETNQRTVYNHFGPGKTTSSLRYEGAQFPIEEIIENVTTWEIIAPPYVPGYGEFILNGDTAHPYGFNVTKSNWTIIEHPSGNSGQQMGGSSRPLEGHLISKADSTVMFTLQQAYNSIDGYNSTYLSELTFKKIK
jgi:hypothetical protein